jgi:hypothetical protein
MGRPTLRSMWVAVVGVGVLALLCAGLTPSSAADQTCIYIVQGLPSRTVSVAVDGDSVVSGLAGGKVAGPLPVKHGTRTVTVSEGGQTLVTSKVKLPAGSNSEIVVHLPASPTGDPMITRFDNNLKPVQKGKAAQAFGHVAAAGPIDIRVDKKVVVANVANGEYLYKVRPKGRSGRPRSAPVRAARRPSSSKAADRGPGSWTRSAGSGVPGWSPC